MHFADRLAAAVRATGAPFAVGLDPHLDRLPAGLRAVFAHRQGADRRAAAADAVLAFNALAIEALRGRVAAIKPQFAFYEALGHAGFRALEETNALCRAAGLLVIGDGKRGDIDSTARAYAEAALSPDGPLACDALTVNPWMGTDTLEPFLEPCRSAGRGLFVLVRTTNPGSAELQGAGEPPMALRLAQRLGALGEALRGPESGLSSLGAVVGTTAVAEAAALRAAMPHAWFLVPGLGAQGGTAAQALSGARPDGLGVLAVASRAVLFPPVPSVAYDADPGAWIAAAAESLRSQLRAG